MQDFNYVTSNCFELTLELSCCKYPNSSDLPLEWSQNKRSLIEYMKLSHLGIKGIVTDSNRYPLEDIEIIVDGLERKPVRTTARGEFWRLLLPGQYRVQAIGFGCVFVIILIYLELFPFPNDQIFFSIQI